MSEQAKQFNPIKSLFKWMGFLILLLLIFFTFRYAIGYTVVSGHSMEPTLENGDVLISSNVFYTPEKYDIVLFENDYGTNVIKRIVALPGDTVKISDGQLIINDKQVNHDFAKGMPSDIEQMTVPEDAFFVMGDNRTPGESLDSRDPDIGPIHRTHLRGKLMTIF